MANSKEKIYSQNDLRELQSWRAFQGGVVWDGRRSMDATSTAVTNNTTKTKNLLADMILPERRGPWPPIDVDDGVLVHCIVCTSL
jgi:hypothetical protein